MRYADLYNIVETHVASQAGSPRPVTFEFLRAEITRDTSLVKNIDVFRVVYSPAIRQARFMLFDERESMHDEPEYHAEISFCSSLDGTPQFLLYALVKELMHVFDPMDTWINTRDRLISFLMDLQNKPLEIQNGSINVEHKARWMAILILCPQTIRDYIKKSYETDKKLKSELAQELGIPSTIVDIVLGDYYDRAKQLMLA